MVSIHNGILLSRKRNEFESVELRWTNPEPVIQSEVSQKEKNKYLKNGTDELICREGVETQM